MVKVKKRKEQWQAVQWDGKNVPEELIEQFGTDNLDTGWGSSLDVSFWSQKDNEWKSVTASKGMWIVFSDFNRAKALADWEFKDKWEEVKD